MHRATKPTVLAFSALLGLGLVSAAAAAAHGEAVSTLAKASQTLSSEARGDAVSALAKSGKALTGEARGDAASTAAKTDATTDSDTTESNDSHGDAVSAVASDHSAVAAHTTGAKKVNHGAAVSLVAQKR